MLRSSNQPEHQSYGAKELAYISDESDVDEHSEDTHWDYAPDIAVVTMVDRKIHVPQLKSRNICTEVTDIEVGKQGITPVMEQNEGVSLDHNQGPSTEPAHGPGAEPAQEVTKEVQSSSKRKGKKRWALVDIVRENHVKYNKFISKQIPKLLEQLDVSSGSESSSGILHIELILTLLCVISF